MPLTIAGTTVMGIGYNPQVPGAFAEFIPLAERMLLEVPRSMHAEHAALVEPMSVGEHAAVYARLAGDEVPLVIGCGPVGLAVIAALKLRAVHPIIAADFSPARRRLAARMGADLVIDPAVASAYEALTQAITPAGYDPSRFAQLTGTAMKRRQAVLFECVGVPGVMQAMFEAAPPGARIVIVGVCMETDSFEPFFGILKQLEVQFVLGFTPDEFAGTLANIAAGRIDVAPLITGRVGLDGVQAAFAELGNPEAHAKILVEPGR
jgi:threonine dehydrogenase-like Zn-dependent dehydrogenase